MSAKGSPSQVALLLCGIFPQVAAAIGQRMTGLRDEVQRRSFHRYEKIFELDVYTAKYVLGYASRCIAAKTFRYPTVDWNGWPQAICHAVFQSGS
jgi:hypothetical protein